MPPIYRTILGLPSPRYAIVTNATSYANAVSALLSSKFYADATDGTICNVPTDFNMYVYNEHGVTNGTYLASLERVSKFMLRDPSTGLPAGEVSEGGESGWDGRWSLFWVPGLDP